jgi:hypothetical protein
MTITQAEYTFLSLLADRHLVPAQPRVLELGAQYWFGDVNIASLQQTIATLVTDQTRQVELVKRLTQALYNHELSQVFELVQIAYQALFNPTEIITIDSDRSDRPDTTISHALCLDLNQPLQLDRTFDLVLNLKTAARLFNVYQVFKTIHELTAPGGTIVQVMPFVGLGNRYFFNFQPSFYWQLAASNGYEMLAFMFLDRDRFIEITNQAGVNQYWRDMQADQGSQPIANTAIYAAMRQSEKPQAFQLPELEPAPIAPKVFWHLPDPSQPASQPERSNASDMAESSSLAETLNLKELNLLVAPDWSMLAGFISVDLAKVAKNLAVHPLKDKITLVLADALNTEEEEYQADPEAVLGEVVMSLLIHDGLDLLNDGPTIAIASQLTPLQWQELQPQLSYYIAIDCEDDLFVSKFVDEWQLSRLDIDNLVDDLDVGDRQ